MKKTITALAMICAFSRVLAFEPVPIHAGYMTGNDFRQLSENSKRAFMMGVVDGIYLAPLFEAPVKRVDSFLACLNDMHATSPQLVAIIDKYMADDPTSWGDNADVLAFRALFAACKSRGVPF